MVFKYKSMKDFFFPAISPSSVQKWKPTPHQQQQTWLRVGSSCRGCAPKGSPICTCTISLLQGHGLLSFFEVLLEDTAMLVFGQHTCLHRQFWTCSPFPTKKWGVCEISLQVSSESVSSSRCQETQPHYMNRWTSCWTKSVASKCQFLLHALKLLSPSLAPRFIH